MKDRGQKTHRQYTQSLKVGSSSDSITFFDCENVSINTKLKNIQAGFNKVKEDDLLQIKMISPDLLGVYNHDKEISGYIASPYNKQLIECMNNGTTYWAKVLSTLGDIQIEN